jgi:hypothetical protein
MSKQSVKSKSNHMAVKETRMFKGQAVDWEGDGIYLFSLSIQVYRRIQDIQTLEFAMKGQYGKTPVYIEEADLNKGD